MAAVHRLPLEQGDDYGDYVSLWLSGAFPERYY
jgi:hypothetical protein